MIFFLAQMIIFLYLSTWHIIIILMINFLMILWFSVLNSCWSQNHLMIVFNYLSRLTFSSSLCLILFWFLIISLICIRFSDDSEKIIYIDEVFLMLFLILNFIEAVIYHFLNKNVEICMFDINLFMFKKKQNSQVYTECCHILCMIDEKSSYWKLYDLSSLNWVLHVTDLIHDFYKTDNYLSVCMIIFEFFYVSLSLLTFVISLNNALTSSSSFQNWLKIWSDITASSLALKKY